MVQGVALLEGDVSSPVAHLDIALEVRDMDDRLRELKSNSDRLLGTGWQLIERTVGQLGALLGRELCNIATSRNLSVVGDAVASGLDLSLLSRGRIGGGRVSREGIDKELRVLLSYRRRQRGVGLGEVVGDGESLLSAGLERLGEFDSVVLNVAVDVFKSALPINLNIFVCLVNLTYLGRTRQHSPGMDLPRRSSCP